MPGRLFLCPLLVTVALAIAPATAAVADVRTATISDGTDPGAMFDVSGVHVQTDRAAGTLTMDVSLHAPLPATFSGGALTYLAAWINDAAPDSCFVAYPGKVGDTSINISPMGTSGELQASVQVKFRSTYSTVPVQIASDRRSLSLTVVDDLLKQSNHRCLDVAGSGQQSYDPSQPGGGSSYDSVDAVWFDGQQPPPPPAPTVPSRTTTPVPGRGTSTVDPPQTPAQICGHPLLKISGADRVAAGSTGPVIVTRSDDGEYSYSGDAKLVMADRATGKAFYSHRFNSRDDDQAADDGLQFFIDLNPERKPAIVALTWSQYPSYTSGLTPATCTAALAVKSVRGSAARFYVRGGGTGELIPRGRHCWDTRGAPTTVTVTAAGRRATFTRRDACERFSGRTRTVGSLRVSPTAYGTISFGSLGAGRARLTVKVAGHTVLRRTVVSKVRSRPDRQVWEGTDEFFNYCVKGAKELHSYQLQLYCIRPGSYREAVLFRR